MAPPSIRRYALVLKSAWKALSDPTSYCAVIAVPARSYRQLQPPTRKSARLNLLGPVLVAEQRLTSRKPFQRAAHTPYANSGEVCPVSANQRKTLADIFVLNNRKQSWHESCAWREYFPTPNLDLSKGTRVGPHGNVSIDCYRVALGWLQTCINMGLWRHLYVTVVPHCKHRSTS